MQGACLSPSRSPCAGLRTSRACLLVAAPYRPTLGEVVTVDLEVANGGVLTGTTAVRLIDDQGITLNETVVELQPGERQRITWSIEAWAVATLAFAFSLTTEASAMCLCPGGRQSSYRGDKGQQCGLDQPRRSCPYPRRGQLVMVRVQGSSSRDRNVWSTSANRPLMRKNEIQPHEAVNHTTEFPSGQRVDSRSSAKASQVRILPPSPSIPHQHASVQPFGIRQDPQTM